jgi:hypothetical protein
MMNGECLQSDNSLPDKVENIVPDSLLALSKDNRYISHISSLISKCFVVSDDNEEENKPVSTFTPEINLLARSICACYIVKENTSLGLSYMGLGYNVDSPVLYFYGILLSLGPYFVERAGKNGWKELKQALAKFYSMDKTNLNAEKDREALKGDDRRLAFEESRRKMLEASVSKQKHLLVSNTIETRLVNRPKMTDKVRQIFWKVMQKMAMVDTSMNPIAFESHGSNTASTNHQHPVSNLSTIFGWIVRLNIALFYASGKYPNLIHRISGLQVKKLSSHIGMVSQRPDFKIISFMIFTQLGAKVVKSFTKMLIQYYFERSIRLQQFKQSIETIVPSANSQQESPNISSKMMTCGICMHTRKYPAAPIGCGHVFCWSCLQHFISTVRPECPLCRCSASPQEIIILQNY